MKIMLTPHEIERYQRQLSLDGFDEAAQERLKDSAALVAGVGGLGGAAALYLAAAGIGRLALIHEGQLETADLNRQALMTSERIGQSRVVQAKETIKNFNPHIEIDIFDEPIKPERLQSVIPDVDIVIDAQHNFPERRLINNACVEAGKPMIEAAMNGMEGYLFSVIPNETACLHCLYPEDPEWAPFGFPVLGAVSGVFGCLAAIEAIKIVSGFQEPFLNTLIHFDMARMELKKFKIHKQEDCALCGHRTGGDKPRPCLQDTHVSARMQANVSAESISL
ncbi:MAG: HesA/MoeB/ThiF family protein [Deltaproteobacteria bacterium]|nr:HesA/MoeB/ThiF family protein [Deltaproteobacteria bacterium]